MEFPSVEGDNAWGVISNSTNTEPSLVRRLSGVYPIRTSLNSNNPLAWNDIHIDLDMNLSGFIKYYTKQQSDKLNLVLTNFTLGLFTNYFTNA